MSRAPDIRSLLSMQNHGVRVQSPGIGAVTIADIGISRFLLAYPSAWASFDQVNTDQLVAASDGDLTPRQAVIIKQLMAAVTIREFSEPREGQPAPASELPGPLLGDAQDILSRVTGANDPVRLAAMMAAMFDWPQERMRRIVEANQQRDAR